MYDPYRVNVSEEMRKDMIMRHLHYGDAFTNHEIAGGKGRIWGTLGELVVGSILGPLGATETLTANYDLVWKSRTYDIKSKTRRDIPLSHWDASISASAMHQKTDYYIFVSIIAQQNLLQESEEFILNFPYTEAYILGYISKDDFLRKATIQMAGKTDSTNGLIYRTDTFTVPYSELTPFRMLINESASTNNSGTESSHRAVPANRPKAFQHFR